MHTTIGILSSAEIKPIIYSVIQLLSKIGAVLFVTPDTSYLNASSSYEDTFTLGDAHILVGSSSDDLHMHTYWEETHYDYVIHDLQRTIPVEPDFLFQVISGNERMENFQSEISQLFDTNKVRIYYGDHKLQTELMVKGMKGCAPHPSHFIETIEIENNRLLKQYSDKQLRTLVSYIGSIILNRTPEEVARRVDKERR